MLKPTVLPLAILVLSVQCATIDKPENDLKVRESSVENFSFEDDTYDMAPRTNDAPPPLEPQSTVEPSGGVSPSGITQDVKGEVDISEECLVVIKQSVGVCLKALPEELKTIIHANVEDLGKHPQFCCKAFHAFRCIKGHVVEAPACSKEKKDVELELDEVFAESKCKPC